uniref:Uncharacterized protein n=1 Tax=Rhabditophanes sp. KR3021 TaxID=114890 RepID=A0AC35U6H2_9BILA
MARCALNSTNKGIFNGLILTCLCVLVLVNSVEPKASYVYITKKADNAQELNEVPVFESTEQSHTDSEESGNGCAIANMPDLHLMVERICVMCHEMFSHTFPNTRAECRAKCFRNKVFSTCLSVFAPFKDEPTKRGMASSMQ